MTDKEKCFRITENLLKDASGSYKNYPLRSLREICMSMDNMSYYKSIQKKYSLKEDLFFDEN